MLLKLFTIYAISMGVMQLLPMEYRMVAGFMTACFGFLIILKEV